MNKDFHDFSPIGIDRNGIDIWNRTSFAFKAKLFPEETNTEYLHYPAGDLAGRSYINLEKPPCGFDDFFQPGKVVVELGCGGGTAALELAGSFPDTKIIALDHEIGRKIFPPRHKLSNLKYASMDWNNLGLPDNSVDRIVSLKGIGDYGDPQSAAELTRISREGTVLRATMNRKKESSRKFRDSLCKSGWEIWITGPELLIAQKKI